MSLVVRVSSDQIRKDVSQNKMTTDKEARPRPGLALFFLLLMSLSLRSLTAAAGAASAPGDNDGASGAAALRGGSAPRSRVVLTADGAYRVPLDEPSRESSPSLRLPSTLAAATTTTTAIARNAAGASDVAGASSSHAASSFPATVDTPYFEAQLIRTWAHDASAFTEGLGFTTFPLLYESTGLYSNLTFHQSASSVRIVDYRTGQIKLHRELESRAFAEGSVALGGFLYVFSYSSNIVRLFNAQTLEPVQIPEKNRHINSGGAGGSSGDATNELTLPPEGPLQGWGATTDGSRIIISDGTSSLHIIDQNLRHLETITVKDGDMLVRDLNELEWVDGLIYANVLGINCIAKILPETGDIVGWIHVPVDKLWPENPDPLSNVLNGIAYDPARKVLLITGKLWPHVFQVETGGRLPKDHDLKGVCASLRKIDYRHTSMQGGWKDFLVDMPKLDATPQEAIDEMFASAKKRL